MKSFEAEFGMEGAARVRDKERQYRDDKIGGLTGAERAALSQIDTGDLSLESPAEEMRRIAEARQKEGKLHDLRVSEEDLRHQGVEPGANPEPSRANEFSGSARQYFAKGPVDDRIESDSMAEMRVQNPELFARMANLKRSKISRQADIMNLEGQMTHQQDDVMRKAQEKVLIQFRRELEAIERELDDLSKV